MKICACGGKLYRNGIVRDVAGDQVGVRYRCAVCGDSFTGPFVEDVVEGKFHLMANGRKTIKDWRYTECAA